MNRTRIYVEYVSQTSGRRYVRRARGTNDNYYSLNRALHFAAKVYDRLADKPGAERLLICRTNGLHREVVGAIPIAAAA